MSTVTVVAFCSTRDPGLIDVNFDSQTERYSSGLRVDLLLVALRAVRQQPARVLQLSVLHVQRRRFRYKPSSCCEVEKDKNGILRCRSSRTKLTVLI